MKYIQINSRAYAVSSRSSGSEVLRVFIPVVKGFSSFHVSYSANGTTDAFRFIYAEGDNI